MIIKNDKVEGQGYITDTSAVITYGTLNKTGDRDYIAIRNPFSVVRKDYTDPLTFKVTSSLCHEYCIMLRTSDGTWTRTIFNLPVDTNIHLLNELDVVLGTFNSVSCMSDNEMIKTFMSFSSALNNLKFHSNSIDEIYTTILEYAVSGLDIYTEAAEQQYIENIYHKFMKEEKLVSAMAETCLDEMKQESGEKSFDDAMRGLKNN